MKFESELASRNIGFCIYANLNDRRHVHSSGFDRSTDDAQVICVNATLFFQTIENLKNFPHIRKSRCALIWLKMTILDIAKPWIKSSIALKLSHILEDVVVVSLKGYVVSNENSFEKTDIFKETCIPLMIINMVSLIIIALFCSFHELQSCPRSY